MLLRLSLSALAMLVSFASPSFAGVITGRVVDFNGLGVPGVNINADFSGGGGHPTLLNDGTDANGYFTTTITPNGVFDISFLPPAPPLTTHLITELFDVSVVGTINLGTIALPRGYSLSGRLLNPAGLGVADVNLDVIDAAGNNLVLQSDSSNASGVFNLAVPLGDHTLRMDTSAVVGQTLASKQSAVNVAGNTDLGTLALAQGFTLTGFVKRTNLVGVAGVQLDVYDSATGTKLYVPLNTTDAAGAFSLIVPAGIFDVRFAPPFALLLVATERVNQVVNANLNLGTLILQNGVVLSGTVQAFNGQKYAGVDVDVFFAGTNNQVVLFNDNTSALGIYQVVIPTGTFDVRFTPLYSMPLASQFVNGVVVTANKLVNGTLPTCPFYSNSGAGTAGTGGAIPQLIATGGAPRLGNPDYALELSNGRGRAVAVFAWTPYTRPVGPFNGGNYLTTLGGYRVVTLSGASGVAGAGSASVSVAIGSQAVLNGLTLDARAYVLDPAAAGGKAYTPFLAATMKL